MAINTEIMVLDEVWYLVDYDQASVPGIIFMSFTETNLNEQRDSVADNIANIDKQAVWKIDMATSQTTVANSIITPKFTVLKDEVAQEVAATITVSGDLTILENNQI
jgi:hypothetical protein